MHQILNFVSSVRKTQDKERCNFIYYGNQTQMSPAKSRIIAHNQNDHTQDVMVTTIKITDCKSVLSGNILKYIQILFSFSL